jgi:hypothetical protein
VAWVGGVLSDDTVTAAEREEALRHMTYSRRAISIARTYISRRRKYALGTGSLLA